jgi:hypothetical protein
MCPTFATNGPSVSTQDGTLQRIDRSGRSVTSGTAARRCSTGRSTRARVGVHRTLSPMFDGCATWRPLSRAFAFSLTASLWVQLSDPAVRYATTLKSEDGIIISW